MYRYEVLNPAENHPKFGASNQEKNDAVFSSGDVYGVEVTFTRHVSLCKANIDPQHTGGNVELAAIEECLTCELPPQSSILATNRADLDSVGGMAVLTMRQQGKAISKQAKTRITMIADSDKFATTDQWEAKPVPKIGDLLDKTPELEAQSGLGILVFDFKVSMSKRVELMVQYLETGTSDGLEQAIAQAKSERDAALQATQFSLMADGRIALAESAHRGATFLGYCMAPVVIAKNSQFRFQGSEPHLKYTVCQYKAGYVDLTKVYEELNKLEQEWGGSPTIIGSPQGVGSIVSDEKLTEIVAKHLL